MANQRRRLEANKNLTRAPLCKRGERTTSSPLKSYGKWLRCAWRSRFSLLCERHRWPLCKLDQWKIRGHATPVHGHFDGVIGFATSQVRQERKTIGELLLGNFQYQRIIGIIIVKMDNFNFDLVSL